jgi:plastocyanin
MRSGAGRSLALVVTAGLALGAGPADSLEGQGVLERPPNLSGGWVGEPGSAHFHFLHRFWMVEGSPDDKLVNSPTLLLAVPLPGSTLVGAQYATNSLVAPGRFNEWELFGRWAPEVPGGLPFRTALTAAYNSAASSVDAELGVSVPLGRVALFGAGRGFSDLARSGEAGWGAAVGAAVRLTRHTALAADVGSVWVEGERERAAWGAALQLQIPTTPHTLSLQVTNTRTGSLHGSSLRDRTRSGPLWGFEFTIPVTFARYVRAVQTGTEASASRAEPGRVEVTMTDDLRFVPGTVEIQAGDTVVWRNTTPVPHTVTAHPDRVRDPEQIELPADAEPFDSGNMMEGDVFRHVFTVPGTYRYVCVPHDMVDMVGTVIVRPRP